MAQARKTPRPSTHKSGLARRQSALLRLSASIASAQSEPDVCRAVVDGLHDEAIGYDFIGVFLLDASTGERVLGASVGWDDIPRGMRMF